MQENYEKRFLSIESDIKELKSSCYRQQKQKFNFSSFISDLCVLLLVIETGVFLAVTFYVVINQ